MKYFRSVYAKNPTVSIRAAERGMRIPYDSGMLTVLGSSSSGNCYLLDVGGEILVIEVGVDVRELQKALNWDYSRVAGCIISHQHRDHAGGLVKVLKNMGLCTFCLREVFSAAGVAGHPFAREVQPLHGFHVGGFRIFPVPVPHDVPCLAYVIEHDGMGRTFFITDAFMCEYRIPGVAHWMVEANYTDEGLGERVLSGTTPKIVADRVRTTHMSVHTAEQLLAANDLSATEDVLLIHMSEDEPEIRTKITHAQR